jgi:hypothetical protein
MPNDISCGESYLIWSDASTHRRLLLCADSLARELLPDPLTDQFFLRNAPCSSDLPKCFGIGRLQMQCEGSRPHEDGFLDLLQLILEIGQVMAIPEAGQLNDGISRWQLIPLHRFFHLSVAPFLFGRHRPGSYGKSFVVRELDDPPHCFIKCR